MGQLCKPFVRALIGLLLGSLFYTGAFAQSTGSVRGQVLDPSGSVMPGITVTVTGADGTGKGATTGSDGRYVINGLPPGKYTVRAGAKGFAPYENVDLDIAGGRPQTFDIHLVLSLEKQEINVTESETTKVDVNPANNASALVLKGADLDALSDDPDDLAAELQALAGPAVGPNGGQIYIDGFTGGRMPPKESIREIRINQNPFSAEFDRVGFGRIEIFTKPGTDRYRGQAFVTYGDSALNSRNPFAPNKPPYQSKHFSGNFSGPLGKKASFFIDASRRDDDDSSVISALTVDPLFQVVPFRQVILNPTKRTSISPRIDYQLSPKNTLMARYSYSQRSKINDGINEFTLPSRAYNLDNTEQVVQATETAVLSAKAINETRFQYHRSRNNQIGNNLQPTVSVLDAFIGGGASIGLAYRNEDRYEIQNYTSLILKTHVLKVGGRLRGLSLADRSTQNYNGTFTFSSTVIRDPSCGCPVTFSPLDAYRITLQGLQNGLTIDQIRAVGGGPSQFSITGGNPVEGIRQYDLGVFAQDDWRMRPNFTLSLGLRYETQNHISDHHDFAPRLGFAWGLGNGKTSQPKTVIRGGFGLFYERFGEDLTLQALRLNGITQQQFLIPFPTFYPNAPPLETLTDNRVPQTVRKVDTRLQAPYIEQAAISIERQLPKNITIALTYSHSHGVHTLRSRNINAPLPGTYDPQVRNSGVRPYGNVGNIYEYESTGIFNQDQLITNVSARVNAKLTLFGYYSFNKARSDTDGAGSFPADQYDLSTEYGRAGFDIRRRVSIGGSVAAPFGIRLSPFIIATSGRPFNIVVGRDLNGDSLFNDRPALATDLTRRSVVVTPYGTFDTSPLPGQIIIPRNYGDGPGQFTVNLRLSKTFGFGERASSSRNPSAENGAPDPAARGGESRRGGGRGDIGGGRGGMRGGMGGPRGGGGFGEGAANHRYNFTFSVSAHNLLNRVNLASPIGNLSSERFGKSNAIGGFGLTGNANRRIELQLRFSF